MASPYLTLPTKKRLLCVAPHPDDGELGMGGTLIKLARQGHDVLLCDMTNGEPTPNGSPEQRQKEWNAATDVMNRGVDRPIKRVNLGLKNREVQHTLEARHKLAAVIREHKADVVFFPYYPDAHPDHIAVHKIAIDARFDAKLTKSTIPGEPHHPKRIIQYFCTHLRTDIAPSFCLDVSDTFEQKLDACACYESQGLSRDGGLLDYVTTMHKFLGGRCGVEYAEPFYSDEVLGLGGLDELV
jgi:bacillithiol biosynthesis deacetylase BshB1